jgi:hypothetical protein
MDDRIHWLDACRELLKLQFELSHSISWYSPGHILARSVEQVQPKMPLNHMKAYLPILTQNSKPPLQQTYEETLTNPPLGIGHLARERASEIFVCNIASHLSDPLASFEVLRVEQPVCTMCVRG